MKTLEQRFWEKVDKKGPDECWPWKAASHERGYGQFYIGDLIPKAHKKKGTMYYATHVMLYLVDGSWDKDSCVMHTCDNPSCVNPSHLKRGTHIENMKDREAKGRNKPRVVYPQNVIDAVLSAHPCLKHIEVSVLLGVPAPYISRLRRGVYTGRGTAKYPNEYYIQHKNRQIGVSR